MRRAQDDRASRDGGGRARLVWYPGFRGPRPGGGMFSYGLQYCRVMLTPPFETTKPNVARIHHEHRLGGTDNFEVDRKAAEAVL